MSLVISTWIWGTKYGAEYVCRLRDAIARNMRQTYEFRVFQPQNDDLYLTHLEGCFARLRMFDPAWQARNGITDRLVNIDLDTVITGELDPLFDRSEPFVIMQGGNAANPCKFNGSMMMLHEGAHPEIWQDFTVEKAKAVPFYSFPDDQGWIWHKLPDAAGWKCGPETGAYVFHKPGWPQPYSDALPAGARLVTFAGWRSPDHFRHLPWVKQYWK